MFWLEVVSVELTLPVQGLRCAGKERAIGLSWSLGVQNTMMTWEFGACQF